MENVSVLSCFSTTDHPSIPSVISSCFHFSSFPCQFLSPRFHRTMMPFEGLCRSVSEPSSFIPRGKLSFRMEEELDVRGKFVCTGSAALCSRHFLRGSSLPLLAKRSLKNRRRVVVNAQDEDPSNDGNASEGTMQIAVEQSKRVLALQKELLQQIAERRNLVSSFKDNLSNSAKKGKSFNASISSEEDQELEKIEDNSEVQNGDVNAAEKSSESLSTTASVGFLSKDKAMPGAVSNGSISDAMQFSERSAAMSSSSALTTPLSTPFVNNEDIRASVKEPKPEEENDVKTEIDIASGAGDAKPPPLAGPNVMNIIVVAAECAPWSKTGGLGDVVGSLPKALARRGHRVMVVVPRYGNYSEARAMGIYKRYNIDGQDMEVSFFHGYIDGVDFIFLESPQFRGFANNIYGGNREDILKRMVLVCKAAVEVPWHVPCGGACYGDGNLVFIANDWHTALLPVYLQAYYRDHGLMKFTRSVLVIHNMAHQGRGPLVDYRFLGLPEHYIENFRLYDPIGGEHMNIFMAGLKTAHRIVTVSHGYAWECQTLEGAWGLHDVIKENAWKLTGIVNGIDDNEWNPEADVHLKTDGYANYSIDTLETGKLACKAALQKELGLPVRSDVPLIGFIGRLDHQKGVDLIADAIPWMINQDMQLVMLGTGRRDLEDMLRSFEGKYHDKVRGWVGFSVRAAHCITAAADILLMPSRFEPCGLNQLYAMRYGTVPVVHAVGGLRDTVKPFDPFSESGLGWTFETAEAQRLIHSLSNALLTYRDFKKSWQGIQKRGMSQDLSWDNAAQQYEKVLVAAKYQW